MPSDGPDLVGEAPFYTTPISSTSTLYHATENCNQINRPESVRERSASFVQWHELRPCPRCHDDVEATGDQSVWNSSPAKEIRFGGDDDD